MRHHHYNPDFNFVKEPAQFNRYSNLPGLTSLVLDCEDAISASDLTAAGQKE
ncbi:MAG: hypothetical protein ACOCQE_04885 [Halanaerobium sp.]